MLMQTIVNCSTYDMIVERSLFSFLLQLLQGSSDSFYLRLKNRRGSGETRQKLPVRLEDLEDYSGMFKKGVFLPLLGALGISILNFCILRGYALILHNSDDVCKSCDTQLDLLLSLSKYINEDTKNFPARCILSLYFSAQ